MTEIAYRIKLARTEKGLSQAALSEKIGVSRPAVSQWETGAIPEKPRMAALAEVLDVDEAWLSGFGERLPIRHKDSAPLDSALMGALMVDWKVILQALAAAAESGQFSVLEESRKAEALKRIYVLGVKNRSMLTAEAAGAICLSVS